ncbi:type II secretion system F family protein [Candidatus Nomurabacteria bacterium]|nr:type II secretion system F family protein [Candidatus Nomurabacteria bacterium]
MNFHYKAVNKEGNIVEGTVNGQSDFEVAKNLKEQGLTVLHVSTEVDTKAKRFWKSILTIGTVSTHEKIIFSRNLAAMLEAGLALSRSLSVMERQNRNKKFKMVLSGINEEIKKGMSLSETLRKYPKVFSSLFIAMVRAGEESGDLIAALKTVSDQMEKTYLLQKRIKGALVYPGVIISAMAVIGVFMLIYVVPTLTSTFQELNVELPTATQFIINTSDFVQNQALMLVIVATLLVVGFVAMMKSVAGRKVFDTVLLYLPLISPLVKETNAARTARTLSSLLSAGVAYLDAVRITYDVVQNHYYKNILKDAEKNVELGLPVSKVFSDATKYYPVFVSEMIAVGEETGELGGMLIKVADFYENEVEQKTKNMSTVVEPFLMIIVGAAVGFFAVSMISPMYSLVEQL